MPGEGKNDGSGTTDELEGKLGQLVPDAKNRAKEEEKEAGAWETVRGAFSTVTAGVGKAWSTLGEWRDTGACLCMCVCVCVFSVQPVRAHCPSLL